tara:strand:+ start:686 stop:1147 length:462 start_codon:yes stop_codon:yes gene_type:complete
MKLIKTKKALLNELHNFIQGTSNQPTLTDLWNDAIEYDVSDLETLKNELEGLDINLSSVDANLSAWKDGTYHAMYDPLHMYEYIFGELRYNRKGNTIPQRGEYWTKDDRYDIWYKHFPEWDDVIHAKKIKDKMMDLTFYLDTADKERIEEIAY